MWRSGPTSPPPKELNHKRPKMEKSAIENAKNVNFVFTTKDHLG